MQSCWSEKFGDRPSTKDVVSVLKELSHVRQNILLLTIGTDSTFLQPPLQTLPMLEVPIPSLNVTEFDEYVPQLDSSSDDDVEMEEESTGIKGSKKRVHFDLPDSGPTSSSLDLSVIAQQETRYYEAVAAREIRAAHELSDSTLPLVHAFQGPDEDWDDNNSSSSGSYVHSTEDEEEEEDIDSSASSFFDSDLLVSPRKPKTFSFQKYLPKYASMASPLTQEVDTAVSEDKPEEADEEEVQRCSLSAISAFIKENAPKDGLYLESFTNNDLVVSLALRDGSLVFIQNITSAPSKHD